MLRSTLTPREWLQREVPAVPAGQPTSLNQQLGLFQGSYGFLYSIYYTLHTMYYVQCTLYYILCTVYNVLCIIYYLLYTMYFTPYALHYIQYTVDYILHEFMSSNYIQLLSKCCPSDTTLQRQ